MAEISVNTRAYCKLLLHAAKYPHCAVNGLLLAEDTKSKETKTLKFVDCIPLFHLALGLTPMLEAALLQIDMYCKSTGQIIAGYYHANENYLDNHLGQLPKLVGKKLQENHHESCIFLVDNSYVSPESVSEVYKVYSLKDSHWKEQDKNKQTVDEFTMKVASTLLSSGAYRQIIDFDNHLDDISNDWRNLELNDLMSRYT